MILSKRDRSIDFLCKFQNLLPWNMLITIHSSLIRSHLYCGDIIFNQVYNYFFHQKINILRSFSIEFLGEFQKYQIHPRFDITFQNSFFSTYSFQIKGSFQESVNLMCSCGCYFESASHFLLYCSKNAMERQILLSSL